MERIIIDIQNDQEKKVLIAFLDSWSYQYRTESDDYILTDEEIKKLVDRKAKFFAGNTTSRPWSEIKQQYKNYGLH